MLIKEIINELENNYQVHIDDFIDLYTRKFSKEDIAEKLGVSYHTVRQIGDKLRLKWNKNNRAASYVKYLVELSADTENEAEALEAPIKENEYLHKKLKVAERAIINARDELNHIRKSVRATTRTESLEEKILNIIERALPIKDDSPVTLNCINTPSNYYKDHVSAIILSDIHAEETVSRADVGGTNYYTWQVMEVRLGRLFSAWANSYRGEDRGIVFLLGDVVSGLIHDTLENTNKPLAEALHDLADLLSKYLNSMTTLFSNIDVLFTSGNHERISEHIKSGSKGMDFGYLFMQILKAKLSSNKQIFVDISTTGYVAAQVGNIWIGGHHGDHHRGAKSESRTFIVQEAFKNVLGIEVHHILEGHTHKFSHHNSNRGASICNGSVIGSNAYGHSNGFTAIRPSQTIVMFEPSGEIDIVKQVFLDV